jgi:hypothetical protein
MIRFTWMQARTQMAVAVVGLAIMAVVLLITGPHLVHLYDTTVATCGSRGDCSSATSQFLTNDRDLQIGLDALIVVIPGIVGFFWGPPLVAREIETGTFRLAWTQSVTRTRWMAVKLGVLGLASVAVVGLLSLMVTWWSSPVDRANMNQFVSFDQRGIVPIGYAVFAFVLGVTAGVLIRRLLPAMVVTLAAFVTTRLVFNHWVRPHLLNPVHKSLALDPTNIGYGSVNGGPNMLMPNPPTIANAWIYPPQIVDKAGHPLTASFLARACPHLGTGGPGLAGPGGPAGPHHGGPGLSVGAVTRVSRAAQGVVTHCVSKLSATFHEVAVYQPANRYWTFQWYELAIYLAASLVLVGICIWSVRRRLS